MRIASLRCTPYALAFRRPLVTARETLHERRGWLLHLGVAFEPGAPAMQSVGEAAPLPAFGGEDLNAARGAIESWCRDLPGHIVDLTPTRSRDSPPALGLLDLSPAPALATPSALHGLETALLRITSRRYDMSLAHWLHPAAPDLVAVNATLGDGDPLETLEAAREALARGFTTLKIKVGAGSPDRDEERLRRVRGELGTAFRIRVDVNGAWNEATARATLQRWAPLDLDYAEQPVPADNPSAMIRLKVESPIPIAADESIRSAEDARKLLELDAAHVLVLKPMLLGGPLTTLRIVEDAHAQGVPVVVTTSLEGRYGRLAALHTAAAVDALHAEAGLPLPPPAHGLATGHLLLHDHSGESGHDLPSPDAQDGHMRVTGP